MKTALVFSLYLFTLPFFALAQNTLVIIGDSLTEGYGIAKDAAYPALVEKKLKKWKVTNAGISGSTSASAAERVSWALKSKPQAILLALGGNDGLRGLDPSEMEKNLAKAVDLAQQAKVKILIAGIEAPPNYGKDYVSRFKEVFPKLAKKKQIPLFPLLIQDVGGKSHLNLPDGIHPNEQGHKLMAENILRFLEKELP